MALPCKISQHTKWSVPHIKSLYIYKILKTMSLSKLGNKEQMKTSGKQIIRNTRKSKEHTHTHTRCVLMTIWQALGDI